MENKKHTVGVDTSLIVSGTATFENAVTISGVLTVNNDATVTSLNATANISVGGTLYVLGAATFGSTLSTSGMITINGTAVTSIKLDDWASPEDNTDLNASTAAHGLTPKLDGDSEHYLSGTGGWTAPTISTTGNISVGGTFHVCGAATFGSTVNISGALTVANSEFILNNKWKFIEIADKLHLQKFNTVTSSYQSITYFDL